MGEGWAISEYLPHPPAILYSLPCFVFDMMWKWENAKRNVVLASAVGFFICYFFIGIFYLPSAVAVVPGGQSLHRGTGRSLILLLQHCSSFQWNIYFCIFEQQHHAYYYHFVWVCAFQQNPIKKETLWQRRHQFKACVIISGQIRISPLALAYLENVQKLKREVEF